MINGHLYRMRGWVAQGVSMDEIAHRFRNVYSREEIESFLAPPKRRRRRKVTSDEQGLDMQPGT